MRAFGRTALALAAAATSYVPLAAQGEPAAAAVIVVVDEVTLNPVPGARVLVRGVGTFLADGQGRVGLPRGVEGALSLSVGSLGYATREAEPTVASGGVVTIPLTPDPALLERIEVVADRLEYLRARHFNPIRVMDSRELADLGSGGIEAHARAMVGGLGPCASAAGGCDGDPAVAFIDDWFFAFRLDELDAFAPPEIYALEVYPKESIVRVYTREFIARAAEDPRLVKLHLPNGLATRPVTAGRTPRFESVLRARLSGY
jgi:hypothetical protein